MTEKTRQNLLGVFLGAVLVLTVAAVWLFAAHRRGQVTALGEKIGGADLGFTIRMPRGWEAAAFYKHSLVDVLAYRQPLDANAGYDGFTRRRPERRIFVLAIRANASDAQILKPLLDLTQGWDMNDNSFHSFRLIQPGPPWLDDNGYEYREGLVTFLYRTYRSRFELIHYEQIRAGGRVFWCVMAGNTQLNVADKALLRAVASSFELLGDSIQSVDQS